jgi:hypothetical protein
MSQQDRPATQRQKDFADELGIRYGKHITVREMSRLIDAALEHRDRPKKGGCLSCLMRLIAVLVLTGLVLAYLAHSQGVTHSPR